jgi:hypothetical protein
LALRHRDRLGDLVEAADRLRGAGGEDAGELRAAAAAERDAAAHLMQLAGEELGEGASGAVLDRVRETLQAIASDADVRSQAQAGRLQREHRVATLGGAPVSATQPGPKRRRSPASKPKEREREREREGELRAARAEMRRLRKRAETARGRERRARDALARAEAKADDARDALERAEAEAADAASAADAGEARVNELQA